MKTRILIALLVSSFALRHSSFAQGSLTPPGAPAPTMKSLDQIEARTPISSAQFTITQPGSYYLTTNLSTSSGDAIDIKTNGVTLDLNGFTISSTLNPANGCGIALVGSVSGGVSNITILNGHIQGNVTTNGAGVYSGTGFGYGIGWSNFPPFRVRISRISVVGCQYGGIVVSSYDSVIVESCSVTTIGGKGIVASSVKDSEALECGGDAITGVNVTNCRGTCTANSYAISSETALNCYGRGFVGVYGQAVLNCYGQTSGSGAGINGTIIQNSVGESSTGNGGGILGTVAQNCYGINFGGGYGVTTTVIAESCCGICNGSGIGIDTTVAHNCWGRSSSGIGVRCLAGTSGTGVATACYGESTSYVGINAYIANGCVGVGPAPISVSYKFNMP